MSGAGPSKHIRMLKRRVDFLKKRADNPDFVNSWDKSEIASLEWAIDKLTLHYPPGPVAHRVKEEA